jgi:exonuclease III
MPCPRQLQKHTRPTTPSPHHNTFPNTNPHTRNPYNTNRDNTPLTLHPPVITTLTFNTRGMHTTILDLQSLLNTQPKTNIIALTETKHMQIKSIWRHTIRNYKLVYNPSHYDKKTKRASAGTILAIDKNTYTSLEPIKIPPTLQPYLAAALLTPKPGSQILVISVYMPQTQTPQGHNRYQELLLWLTTLLTKTHPTLPTIVGGDLQATPHQTHKSHYPPYGSSATQHHSSI